MTTSTQTTDTQDETTTPAAPDVRIVVLQRGWIVVGTYACDGDDVTISDAKVIRRWGTTAGLGQLRGGPRPNTVLDNAGTVRAHRLAVVLTIDVDPSGWIA